jgi:PilZ domain-containing protein
MFRRLFTRVRPAKENSGASKSVPPKATPVDSSKGFPRRFTRVRPTGRNGDLAKVVVNPKEAPVDCRIVDYSPGGACLEVWGQVKLPERFELVFGPTRKRCRVVWRAGRRLGVSF